MRCFVGGDSVAEGIGSFLDKSLSKTQHRARSASETPPTIDIRFALRWPRHSLAFPRRLCYGENYAC